jgi:hypothetical protein
VIGPGPRLLPGPRAAYRRFSPPAAGGRTAVRPPEPHGSPNAVRRRHISNNSTSIAVAVISQRIRRRSCRRHISNNRRA